MSANTVNSASTSAQLRALAFYLPQFHPVPENDEWWGAGFTEWRNVAKARPRFARHYQPHLPADLGFYDLRLPEIRAQQAALAREYGVHGFVYYHYWFNGRRILERPFNEVLESGSPDFPFCLCWANENWTRVWDGGEKNILLQQNYSLDDDRRHIRSLLPAFKDERYIRINGKPFFAVYRAELLPDPVRTTEIWREEAQKAGIGDLYLARVESFNSVRGNLQATAFGFDADIEFAPFSWPMGNALFREPVSRMLAFLGLLPKTLTDNHIISYDDMVRGMLSRAESSRMRFPCVTPSWDNSARRASGANIFIDSSPAQYEAWLRRASEIAVNRAATADERIIFINAWNEWAEGNHLEPDLKWGLGYLESTLRALSSEIIESASLVRKSPEPDKKMAIKKLYWKMQNFLKAHSHILRHLGRK